MIKILLLGAQKLGSDCAQIEFALSLLLGPTGYSSSGPTGLNTIGKKYSITGFIVWLTILIADLDSF